MRIKEFIRFGELHETALKYLVQDINKFMDSMPNMKVISVSHDISEAKEKTKDSERILFAASAILCYE